MGAADPAAIRALFIPRPHALDEHGALSAFEWIRIRAHGIIHLLVGHDPGVLPVHVRFRDRLPGAGGKHRGPVINDMGLAPRFHQAFKAAHRTAGRGNVRIFKDLDLLMAFHRLDYRLKHGSHRLTLAA